MSGPNFIEPPGDFPMTSEQLAELTRKLREIQDEVVEGRVVATFNAHSAYEARILSNAGALRVALDDYYQILRSQAKHGPDNWTIRPDEIYQLFLDHLGEYLGG